MKMKRKTLTLQDLLENPGMSIFGEEVEEQMRKAKQKEIDDENRHYQELGDFIEKNPIGGHLRGLKGTQK